MEGNATTSGGGIKDLLPGLIILEIALAALIALFGIAGNILTILVLRVPNLRQTSTAFYFAALASVDILVLLIGPTVKAVSAAVFESERHIRDTSMLSCKLILYVNYSSSQISAWVLVAVTIDRAIWVLLPFKARQVCTVRRAAIVLAVICTLICCINTQVLMSANLGPGNATQKCHLHYSIMRHAYVSYIDPGLVTIGPFLIMLAANLLIIRKLRQVRARRETSLNKQRRGDSGRNLTKMLLCTNFFYLFSSLPYLLIMRLLNEKRPEIMKRPALMNFVYLIQGLCYSLFNLNYAIHFLLYCLAGPAFKAEAFRILGIRQAGGQGQGTCSGTAGGGGERSRAGANTCDVEESSYQQQQRQQQRQQQQQQQQQRGHGEEMELLPVTAETNNDDRRVENSDDM